MPWLGLVLSCAVVLFTILYAAAAKRESRHCVSQQGTIAPSSLLTEGTQRSMIAMLLASIREWLPKAEHPRAVAAVVVFTC